MTAPRRIRVSEPPNAREAVLVALGCSHDYFAEQEQLLVGAGRYAEAAVAHQYALWVLRAYRSELDDPAVTE